MLTRKEIAKKLLDLGIQKGHIVLLHSSLSSIGWVKGGADAVIDAFLNVLGPEGTLVVPTFGPFGIITEKLKQRPNAISSIHPKACVVALGANARDLCANHWKQATAHGENTPYKRIVDRGGYICLLGVDQDRSTLLHTAEAILRLPYLKTTPELTFNTPKGIITKSWDFFPGPHRDFIGLDSILRERNIMKIGRIGNAVVRLIKGKDLIQTCLDLGEANPAFALCDNPNCMDCVMQRADLRRSRFDNEHFLVVASSNLAGYFVPEMIESLNRAGLDYIELDTIEGLPVNSVPTGKLKKAVVELKEAGIKIHALHLSAVPIDIYEMALFAKELGIPRIVMPLAGNISHLAARCQECKVMPVFYNLGIRSNAALAQLLSLHVSDFGFAFHAAQFARAGEKPFLESYNTKLRRYITQLFVEDTTFNGESVGLAQGNAEIKELISILRCASFTGALVLGAGNRHIDNLLNVTRRFEQLLNEM